MSDIQAETSREIPKKVKVTNAECGDNECQQILQKTTDGEWREE